MRLRTLGLVAFVSGCAINGPQRPLQRPSPITATLIPPEPQRPLSAVPTTGKQVLNDYRVADRLTVAYVGSPGATAAGMARARQLSAAATRAVTLMRKRGHPEDVRTAQAAVSELLDQVK